VTEPDSLLGAPAGGQPGAAARGVGESRDAPAADVPTVEELSADQPTTQSPGTGQRVVLEVVTTEASTITVHPDGITVESGSVSQAGPVPGTPLPPQQVRLRRSPRYQVFIGTGAGVGAVLGVVLTGLFPDSGGYSTGTVLGYLVVGLALIGGLLGGAVAVLADRRS
jgi:hypothetical protein